MVRCGRARRTRDAWSTPRTMSASRTSTIPFGSLPPVRRGGPGCPGPLLFGLCGCPGRRPPGCSRCRVWSHPGSSPALPLSAGRRAWLRAPPWAVLRHLGRVRDVAWGNSLLQCSGPISTQGRGWARCPPAGVGSVGTPPAGGPGTISMSESASASSWGGSSSPPLSPSALMTLCAASSVGDRGHVSHGAAGSAIVVSMCLRAGDGVWISRCWCTCCGRGRALVGSSNIGSLARCLCARVEVRRSPYCPCGTGGPVLLRGVSEVRRSPVPSCPSSGRAVGVCHPRVAGAGARAWGPGVCHLRLHALRGAACREAGGGPPLVRWPSTVARPSRRGARAMRPVFPGCGCRGRGDPAPAPQHACAPGSRRCVLWGWQEGPPERLPCAVADDVWIQALSHPRPATQLLCVGAQHCSLGLHVPRGAA